MYILDEEEVMDGLKAFVKITAIFLGSLALLVVLFFLIAFLTY